MEGGSGDKLMKEDFVHELWVQYQAGLAGPFNELIWLWAARDAQGWLCPLAARGAFGVALLLTSFATVQLRYAAPHPFLPRPVLASPALVVCLPYCSLLSTGC